MSLSSLARQVLDQTDNLPIRHDALYKGKVRSLYRLSAKDSTRLIQQRGYDLPASQALGVMVTSDRISAFDCNWIGQEGLLGVPNKGAALNAIAYTLFERLREEGIAEHHVLEVLHPLVWIVRIAAPLRFEGILRRYITGSLWRAYARGERHLYGLQLPEGLQQNQKLSDLLFTPSTKGTILGLKGVPETEDAPLHPKDIQDHYAAFGLPSAETLDQVIHLLERAFVCMEKSYTNMGQILIDTKFELGYVPQHDGSQRLILMDEVGTPDASRLWDQKKYKEGQIFEYCKEHFRQTLLEQLDSALLLDPARLDERKVYAFQHPLPNAWLMDVSQRYTHIAEQLMGASLPNIQDAHREILECLGNLDLLH